MTTNRLSAKRLYRLFLPPVLLPLALIACQEPRHPVDYRQGAPLIVSGETMTLAIVVPAGKETLSFGDTRRFNRFVGDYLARGRGPLVVEASGVGGDVHLRRAREKWLGKMLSDAGLRSGEIVIKPARPAAAKKNALVFSFAANKVTVPECGDWSSSVGLNWTNRRHPNFGCSIQRNVGLTVADPGDLAKPKPLSAKTSPHGVAIIWTYTTDPPTPISGSGAGSPDIRVPAASE